MEGRNISDIIVSFIRGKISDDDLNYLEMWMAESSENKTFFEDIVDEESIKNRLSLEKEIDVKMAFKKIKKRKSVFHFSVKRGLAYAAAIILPFLVFQYIYISEKESPNVSVEIATIHSGESKAQLFLADGKSVILEKQLRDTISDGASSVVANNGTLKYEAKSSSIKLLYNKLIIPKGGEFNLVLADGTKVWLNAESELRYPVVFNKDERRVFLKGEAFFDVTKDKNKRFVVESGDVEVKVFGTKFNMRNYLDEQSIATTLVEGSVQMVSKGGSCMIKPNQQAVMRGGSLSVANINVCEFVAWKNGRFMFKHRRLEDVLRNISRWYDINIFYQNESVKNKLVTGSIRRYDDFGEFLKMIEMTEVADFRIKGNTIIISER